MAESGRSQYSLATEILSSNDAANRDSDTPLDVLYERCAAIRRLTSNSIPRLHGCTPEEHAMGSTPDISTYAMFDWYQIIYYSTSVEQFPQDRKLIGAWIGVSENCEDGMALLF
jgi:hypothetical protein